MSFISRSRYFPPPHLFIFVHICRSRRHEEEELFSGCLWPRVYPTSRAVRVVEYLTLSGRLSYTVADLRLLDIPVLYYI